MLLTEKVDNTHLLLPYQFSQHKKILKFLSVVEQLKIVRILKRSDVKIHNIEFGFRITGVCRSFRHRARQSGTLYLCHFSTEMAEIWSPVTFFEDVWTHKISALYHFYFQNYKT